MRRALTTLLLLAACQPQSRRLLVLDLTLGDPLRLRYWTASFGVVFKK